MIRYAYRKYKKKRAAEATQPQEAQTVPDSSNEKLCEHRSRRDKDEVAASTLDVVPQPPADKTGVPNAAASEVCLECKAEKTRRRVYRWKLMVALFPSAFLAAIDTTIVATALTTIASHFST
jgi:hypothetical protein